MYFGEGATELTAPWVLWPFQATGVDRIEQSLTAHRRVLVASPTGSGKTIVGMELVRRALNRHKTCMFAAPRRELLKQAAEKLDTFAALRYGMITADRSGGSNLYANMQVASVDTLISRVLKRQNLVLPPIDRLILDEAHLYSSKLRTELLQLFPYTQIIGLSATPAAPNGRALNIGFEELIELATIRELMELGYLVSKVEYFGPSSADLKEARRIAGEYNAKDVEVAMKPILGEVVPSWLRLAAGRRTAVFVNSVGNSVWLAEQFRNAGVSAEHCDGTAEDTYRDAVFDRFRSGETEVLCNVNLATYGFDLPEISCIHMVDATLSVVKYLQMIGRGMRAFPGKENLIVIDQGGNFQEHGAVHEDRHWTLAGYEKTAKGKDVITRSGDREKKELHLKCPKCTYMFGGALTCPNCGYYFEKTAKAFKVVDGELVSLHSPEKLSEMERVQFHAELLGVAKERGYQLGWAAHAFMAKYKAFPPKEWNYNRPMVPTERTKGFVKYLAIRRAHSRKKSA